ncbi:MAG: hypothetical protein ACFB10_12695, partial [Salibacteraceae bacterium]
PKEQAARNERQETAGAEPQWREPEKPTRAKEPTKEESEKDCMRKGKNEKQIYKTKNKYKYKICNIFLAILFFI